MSDVGEKIELVVSERRVKMHLFEPSQRKVWTVVGKGKEHWLDPKQQYCSCPGFYFGKLNGKETCYHIKAVKLAEKEKKYEIIKFSDDEYQNFLSGIMDDL